MNKLLVASACAFVAMPVMAQMQSAPTTSNAATPPVPAIAAPTQAVLRAQTPIALRMSEELTTKKKVARVGQRFRLEVSEPVEVNGVVVIPAGSPATGEITQVRNKGMWGKSGYINAQLVHVRVGDRTIRLSGTFDDKGITGTGGVVASIALIPLAGFFTTGTSATIPMGSGVKGFIDEDVPLALVAAAPAPMTVTAPAPALPVTAPTSVPPPASPATTSSSTAQN